MKNTEEFDYIIIGSGFGGSVSAMRLAQKGYSVAVIESGKRWTAETFPKSNWSFRKFFWFPGIFAYGIQRLNLLNDVMVLSGAGVGGGSLVYANTLYVPKPRFFEHPTVRQIGADKELLPYYELAKKMLGVTTNPRLGEPDYLLRDLAAEDGQGHTFTPTPVGVFFGEQDKMVTDPYFKGEGPDRAGCNFCGGCMVGCRFHAKNTLDKNYLYFAEQFGATVIPETKVVDIIPHGENGSDGYTVKTKKMTAVLGGLPRRQYRAKNLVISAGVLGTLSLLFKMKEKGRLPAISDQLGQVVRTNSEALVGVRAGVKGIDFTKGVAITSSIHPDEHTHIEPVKYSKGSDAMGTLTTLLTDGGGKIPRPLRFFGNILRNPLKFLNTLNPFGWAQNTIILLVMQTLDNHLHLRRRRRWIWPFVKSLSSYRKKGEEAPPTYIPLANNYVRRLEKKLKGVGWSAINEVLLDVPTTAHVLGGCPMGESPDEAVIDLRNRLFGYENILVCDGSMIPANPGVNPSLSITAFTERAMSFVPPKEDYRELKSLKAEEEWRVTDLFLRHAYGEEDGSISDHETRMAAPVKKKAGPKRKKKATRKKKTAARKKKAVTRRKKSARKKKVSAKKSPRGVAPAKKKKATRKKKKSTARKKR